MLSAEQHEMRRSGIGASEIAAVAEIDPYKGAIDVWLSKRGLVEADGRENEAMSVGRALEAGLRVLYTERTGLAVVEGSTLRHPAFPWVLATPDALALGADRGLEIKVVGARMAHHWQEDSVPDYVVMQAAQNMAVTGRGAWDVLALIGGTELRLATIERDPEVEASLLEIARVFWHEHVLADVAPEILEPEARRRYLRVRYPGSDRTGCASAPSEAQALVEELACTRAHLASIMAREEELEQDLCALVGAEYGIEGPWGRFLWYPRRGTVAWKAVAEQLAGGAIPQSIVEQHRGQATRVPALYMKGARRGRDR